VNLAGLVETICFDKTGTLTEEGLDVMAVRESSQIHPEDRAAFIAEEPEIDQSGDDLMKVLVGCHGLALLKGNLVGDSLEVKMFHATNWSLYEPDVGSDYLKDGILSIVSSSELHNNPDRAFGILKRFDFSSELQRMSTICVDMNTKELFICSKGAPEVISKIASPLSRLCFHTSRICA
jgi:magnesium-transporting ATPase (P-type)